MFKRKLCVYKCLNIKQELLNQRLLVSEDIDGELKEKSKKRMMGSQNTIQKIMAVSKSSIFQKRKTADTHIYHSELVYLLHILAI
jgi:hypothetical protein